MKARLDERLCMSFWHYPLSLVSAEQTVKQGIHHTLFVLTAMPSPIVDLQSLSGRTAKSGLFPHNYDTDPTCMLHS